MRGNNIITIIGFFADGQDNCGGQENKTRALYELLCTSRNVIKVDTFNWRKKPIRLFIKTISSILKSQTIIMLPAQNGVEIFSRLVYYFGFGKKRYYNVIGGWLPEKLEKKSRLRKILSKFDGIWVETHSMKNRLNEQRLNNVTVVPNFKNIVPLKSEDLQKEYKAPYAVCTFSRVLKEKGIGDAIEAIIKINTDSKKVIYRLDIYGPIDDVYKEEFQAIMKKAPEYIRYCGKKGPDEVVDTLKKYFLLLFPTYYAGEGMAGTMIDALASGIPIVATDWRYNSEIVSKEVGFLYEPQNIAELCSVLKHLSENPDLIVEKKENCIKESKKYTLTGGGLKIFEMI